MSALRQMVLVSVIVCVSASVGLGQAYGQPDRGQPGDEMIQAYLAQRTEQIHEKFAEDIKSLEDWERLRPQYRQEYLYMLGLDPMPEKTPLKATITGTLRGDGYVVDMLHYQSMPRLYVTGNLYRPANAKAGERLPAVLYVCGHSFCGRNGNKTAYQSHGMWFARHGYVCLVLDTLQLGEIAAIHHGTYREGRWWWHSRGYTPAGVECLNGIRGIDYLISRSDVDPERIAVTGISGGGAATFWIAAADERVKVAVPVSGMADLPSYVGNRVINGHCDCMFLYNTFQWPWTRIAGLIAPRPMLFTNSDADAIFPMDANQRVINRLERLYSLYGAGDLVDSFVSIGGHAYRQDIRQAAYRFINMHLKNDPRIVTDSEVDIPTGPRDKREYSIDPEKLRVFPKDSDIPKDELNTTIDRHFIPIAKVEPPQPGQFDPWKTSILAKLHGVVFRDFPGRIPPAIPGDACLLSEPGIKIGMLRTPKLFSGERPARILLFVQHPELTDQTPNRVREPNDQMYICVPRGISRTRWTQKNPPNYVERSHVLLGRTVDTGRVWDVIAVARYLLAEHADVPLYVAGEGPGAVLAVCAALLEADIAGVIAVNPPSSHMDDNAPQFLNVLRVCDIPDVLGMLAPRRLTVHGADAKIRAKVAQFYAAADASGRVEFRMGEDIIKTPTGDLTISFIGHGTLMFDYDGKIVHVDPVSSEADYSKLPKADLILITHEHGDHLDPMAIDQICKEGTRIVLTEACSGKVAGGTVMKNGDVATVQGFKIEAVPAYNIVNKRPGGGPFHPKGSGNGYVITFGTTRVYVAGDTENIPEMKELKDIDIAFLPMNLPYTMTPEMVAEAARAFEPRILYPYHYGQTDPTALVNLLKDSEKIEVRIRDLR